MITQSEYKRVWRLKKELYGLTVRIRELELPYSGIRYESDGSSHGSNVPDLTARSAHKLIDLRAERLAMQQEYDQLQIRILQDIDSLDDHILASILSARYIRGLTWTQTARLINGSNTPDSCRMMAARYLSTLPE